MPRWSFTFTATVTDLKTDEREQITDTAHFDYPITRADALSLIRRELRAQNKPALSLRITDSY
ncbi:hypothetical protein [Streptomyces glaucescens]|uniref:hypothetical protein n=1 Tax=Streptomyces glaucescens TaxID=1907 RepID=UPI000A3A1E1B|nr:hypothetical protein [Streptomyces glaucescens]